MRNYIPLVLFALFVSVGFGQVLPSKEGELSTTRLLKVERLVSHVADELPDGLVFHFLVSRKAPAEHKFAIKETRDFIVSGQSYRNATEAKLGRSSDAQTGVHDAIKYAAEHPEFATPVSGAPKRSLIITVAIRGCNLMEGRDVELILHTGFGRTTGAPEGEDLNFKTQVPAQ
jgi:hypothetical protein